MAVVLLWKDGTEDSLLGCVTLGMEWRKSGEEVAILITGAALGCVAGRGLSWSPSLKDRSSRITILKNGKEMGLSYQRDFDARWTDPDKLLAQARAEGIRLLADPIWAKLLGVDGRLPDCIDAMETEQLLQTLREASPLVGGF